MLVKYLLRIFALTLPVCFFPFMRIAELPIAYVIGFITLPIAIFNFRTHRSYSNRMLFILLLVLSFPPLLIGIGKNMENAILTYLLGLSAFSSSSLILKSSRKERLILFRTMLAVCLVVVLYGTLIRLLIIPSIFFKSETSELLIGYWGIRYQPSTRNADYIVPLLALIINRHITGIDSILSKLIQVFLSVILIFSLSRVALIIAIMALLEIFIKSGLKTIVLFTLSALTFFYTKIIDYFEFVPDIFRSIFEGGKKYSNADRESLLIDTLHSIKSNPLGQGVGAFEIAGKHSAESAFLTIFVEYGWCFSICFLLFLFIKWINRGVFNILAKTMVSLYFMFNYELNHFLGTFMFAFVLFSDSIYLRSNQYVEHTQ